MYRKVVPPKSGTNTKSVACSADVTINFGLGFIPGYNAVKVTVALTGINFNPVEAALGYKSVLTAGPSPIQAAAGATSAYSFYRWSVSDAAGGASALNRFTDLAGRASFAGKSASAQASLLGEISKLSNSAKVASGAGTVANLLNVASAGSISTTTGVSHEATVSHFGVCLWLPQFDRIHRLAACSPVVA